MLLHVLEMPDHLLAFITSGATPGSFHLSSKISFGIQALNLSISDATSSIVILFAHTGVDDLAVRNGNVARALLEVEGSDVGERSIQDTITVFQRTHSLLGFRTQLLLRFVLERSLLCRLLHLDRARVLDLLNAGDVIVTQAIDMHAVVLVKVGATNIPVEADSVFVLFIGRLDNIESVSDHVGMLQPPAQGLNLLDSNEACKIVHLSLGVATIGLQTREVEELCTVVNLFPEALLHSLLCLAQRLVKLIVVQVSQYTHHIRHTMVVQQAKELKGLHFEANTSIDQQERQVHDFGHVDHSLHVCRTLHKCDALVLVRSQSDRASHRCHLLLGEMMDE